MTFGVCGADWQGWEQEAILAEVSGDLQVSAHGIRDSGGVATKAMRLNRKWHLRLQQVNCNNCQRELKSHLETLPARRRGLRPGIPQISCSRLRAKDCCYCYPKTPPVALLQPGEVVGGLGYSFSLTERHVASYSGEFHVSSCLHVKLHRTQV